MFQWQIVSLNDGSEILQPMLTEIFERCKMCLTLMAAELMNVQPTRQSFLLTVLSHAKVKRTGCWLMKAGGEGKEEVVEKLRKAKVRDGRVAWTWRVNGKSRSELGFLGIEGVHTGKGLSFSKKRDKSGQSCLPPSALFS